MSVMLSVVQGEPLKVVSTVVRGAVRWPEGQAVKGRIVDTSGAPVLDLAPFLSTAVEGDDVVVTLEMTGADTRQVARSGHYDVFVHELDGEARSLRVLDGPVMVDPAITP